MLNRSAVVLRPGRPLIEWERRVNPRSPAGAVERSDPTVWLIPPLESPDGATAVLRERFVGIFEYELNSWHMDEANWPPRTWENFQEWFRIEVHEVVEDAGDGPVGEDDGGEPAAPTLN